jgi:hypothetical protein
LVLLVNFQDNAGQTPFNLDQTRDAVFGDVSNFYREASYGQTWLEGEVRGWYTLPIASTCNTIDISAAADAAAAADGLELGDYGRIIYVMKSAEQCFWSGSSNMWVYPSRAWLNGTLSPKVIAHELGHGFGLHHSDFLDCGDRVLGPDCVRATDDKFDLMGASSEPAHFNGFQKELLGWLQPSDIRTVTVTGTYNIAPLEISGGQLPKLIKIPKGTDPVTGGSTWYYLEYRQALGFDSFLAGNANVMNGVLVHTGSDLDDNSSLLLDMTPNSNLLTFYDRSDPALAVGSSFSDPDAGVTLTTIWADANSARVAIELNQSVCVAGIPGLTVLPGTSQAVTAGTLLSFQVELTNVDSGPACAASDFSIQENASAGWTVVVQPVLTTVEPGATSIVAMEITSPLTATDGLYEIDVFAEHLGSPGNYATASAIYAVGNSMGNSTPIPADDSVTTPPETPVTIAVLENDIDPDGDALAVIAVEPAGAGTVTLNANGTLTYLPAQKNGKHEDRFAYTVSDGISSASAMVVVNVARKKSSSGKGNGKGR